MKILLTGALLSLTFSLNAQTPQPVPLARGNTPGEPHHHLKIENEYVRAYYVEVPPHQATQLHQHDHDYIYVSLGTADVVNAILNKPEIHLQLKDGETHFTRGGFAHIARNLADTPFRNITIELLKSQGDAHNLCAQVMMSDPPGRCDKLVEPEVALEPQFDTAGCRLEVWKVSPRTDVTLYANKKAHLIVVLDSEIRVAEKGKPLKTLHEGEMIWTDAATDAQLTNEKSKTGSFLNITLKDTAAP